MKFKDLFKTDEDYKKFIELIGNEKSEEFEKEFEGKELSVVPYSRFSEVNDKKKEAMEANEALKKQLNKLEKESISPEDFQTKSQKIIDEYEEKIKSIEADAFNVKRDYAIKDALAIAKAKHPDLLVKQLNMEKIKEKDGKFEGINEQIDELKKSYADLFDAENDNNGADGNGSIYSGIRRQGLSQENLNIVDMFKEGFFPDSSND